MGVFEVFQIPYSAVQREHEQLITRAAEARRRRPGPRWRRARRAVRRQGVGGPPIGLGADDARRRWDEGAIDDLLDGMSRIEFTLRFTLSHPGLSSTIVGHEPHRAPAVEHRDRHERPVGARRVRRGQAPPPGQLKTNSSRTRNALAGERALRVVLCDEFKAAEAAAEVRQRGARPCRRSVDLAKEDNVRAAVRLLDDAALERCQCVTQERLAP